MYWYQIKANWKQLTGRAREKWGDLTDDDLERIAGNRDMLIGKIQEQYGIGKQEAERQVKDFESSVRL